MCLQSTFAATIRAIVTTNWRLTIPAASVTRYAPVFPLPQCFPSIASKPEQARCSYAILQSARVLQKLIRLGGKKEPRNPPASAQQPRPPVPHLSPEAQEVRFPPRSPSPQSCQLARSRALMLQRRSSHLFPGLPQHSHRRSGVQLSFRRSSRCSSAYRKGCLCSHRRECARLCALKHVSCADADAASQVLQTPLQLCRRRSSVATCVQTWCVSAACSRLARACMLCGGAC